MDRSLDSRLAEIRDGCPAHPLVERLWKRELIRDGCVLTRSGELQRPFVRDVHDLRPLGYARPA